ncbi:hypothetical protein ACHAW6_012108 [Cyclotella cf. meneghiniana]
MPPPPPPSASYNLVIVVSSDEENDETYSSDDAFGYNSLPWAEATPMTKHASTFYPGNGHIVEAANVSIVGTTEEDSDEPSDDEEEDLAASLEVNACLPGENDVTSANKAKKKKKNKKKSKKKKKKSKIERQIIEADVVCENTSLASDSSQRVEEIQRKGTITSNPKKSVTFGTVSVREYARTLGTHTVPADGGWPLGLSSNLDVEHTHQQWMDHQKTQTENGSPSSPSKHARNGQHSPATTHGHRTDHPRGWTVASFEARRQTELQQRYIQLIRDQRRRKYEKEWEKKHLNKFHSGHSYNTRKGRKRTDSTGGVRSSSGKLKMEMSLEEKEEMERWIAEPVVLPPVEYFETRQYDYKKRVKAVKNVDPNMTEEAELLMNHRGRNPLFVVLKEEERRKVLLRDDQWFKQYHVIHEKDDDRCRPSNDKRIQSHEDHELVDLTDPTVTQHIQHELEALRIQRSDPANLGCSCRKLHVFLPGSTDKSHNKKKGSHRRLPERKVREELRRRGISADGMSRDKMESALHDAIEKEPCCSNNDCPCVRSGIGCQADTCSCWHPSHEGANTAAGSSSKKEHSEARNVVDQDVHEIEERCGNVNGMYVVNFGKIRRYRERHLSYCVEVGAS